MRKKATLNGKITDVYRRLEEIRNDLCEMIDDESYNIESDDEYSETYKERISDIVDNLSNVNDCIEEAINILEDIHA